MEPREPHTEEHVARLTKEDVRLLRGILKKAQPQPEEDAHFTPSQLSARWGVTPITLRRWRHEGRIRALSLGRTIRFTRAEVERVELESEI